MKKVSFRLPLILFSLICLSFLGCGDKVGLKGKVVFSDDGAPLTVGTVCFSTPTFQAKGDIDAQGNFTMGSIAEADGLPPGKYQVSIIGAEREQEGFGKEYLVAEKWCSPKNSGLTVDVDKSTKFIEIKVDRFPKKP